MDERDENTKTKINGFIKDIVIKKTLQNVIYESNITELDLSNNKLTEVPVKVLELNNLKNLDLSFNLIVFFNETPCFSRTVEWLNLSNNHLEGPPFWVWAEKPKKLAYLNLSNNNNICKSFTGDYFDHLLQFKTLVNEIDFHNCNLGKYIKLMTTFCHARVINMGCEDFNYFNLNNIDVLPCPGLEECHEVEKMNLSNTQLYQINSSIDIYQNIKEINLAQNKLNGLPNEFCNLLNLHTCILSYNKLLYLPDNMDKLAKLERLYLNDNILCMLPHNLHKITSLKVLDVYNNNLYDVFDNINNLEELDFAQNFFEEPDAEEYLRKKEQLRLNYPSRENGRKIEEIREDSEHSSKFSDDDEEVYALTERCADSALQDVPETQCSSPEDWDSDDYWIPQYQRPVTPPRSPWRIFAEKKMKEGNFCPMDAHIASIADVVKYEKLCNPRVVMEIEGQFDDLSEDDS